MKFGFSIENTSGHCKLKSILRKSHFWGSRSPKTPKFSPFFRELETNANEIRFQYRKYLRPVQVKVHFAKFVFWGSRGPKTPKSYLLVDCKALHCEPRRTTTSIEVLDCVDFIISVFQNIGSRPLVKFCRFLPP